MKPLLYKATEGRANPKGISCLYLASDKETAMSEVRPNIGSYVSVGQFKLLKNITIIDCSKFHALGSKFYFEEPGEEEKENTVWAHIDQSFSKPANETNDIANYASTQIIAELFKNEGYDGIVYKSSLGKGFNIALFDLNSADLVNCFLYETNKVEYKFEETANPYFVSKHMK